MLVRFARAWHPLARLNLIVMILCLVVQILAMVVILLLLPTSVPRNVAKWFLQFAQLWYLMLLMSSAYLVWNAFLLHMRHQRRPGYATGRHVFMAWGSAILLFLFVLTWYPMISSAFGLRRTLTFNSSKDEMLRICEAVLAEGTDAEGLGTDHDIGGFSRVDVTLREDGQVWFDIGDTLLQAGYVCLSEGSAAPRDTDEYSFERLDDRFYSFLEKDESRRDRLIDNDE